MTARLGLMARFWNCADLAAEWVKAHVWNVDVAILMDCGSSDGTPAVVEKALADVPPNVTVEFYHLPPTAPMRSGLWCNMLLQRLKHHNVHVVLALDHDEFVEPEFWFLLPLLLGQPKVTYWEFPRANFQFSRMVYSLAPGDRRFRERILFRLDRRHFYVDDPNEPHHLERVPLGGPERPSGGARLPAPIRERCGRSLGLVLKHFNQRNLDRSRLWRERLKVEAGEDRPNLTRSPDKLLAELAERNELGTWIDYTAWLDENLDRGWGKPLDILTPIERESIVAALAEHFTAGRR